MSASADSGETSSQDPTGTVTLRSREFTPEFNKRWRDTRGVIRETVDQNDALRLQGGPQPTTGTRAGQYTGRVVQDFGVDDDAGRRTEWAAWFPAVLDRYIRESKSPERVRNGDHYTSTYLRRAYSRGLALANMDARQHDLGTTDGDELPDPTDLVTRDDHQGALAGLYLATYDDIQRAVDETRSSVARTLASGLAANWGVREMADELTGRVDAVGQTRTATIANTRVVDTVNEAILTRGEALGVTEVGVAPETVPEDDGGEDGTDARWATAGDTRVCEECAALSGETYSIQAVRRGDAPRPVRDTHPRCRCRYLLLG